MTVLILLQQANDSSGVRAAWYDPEKIYPAVIATLLFMIIGFLLLEFRRSLNIEAPRVETHWGGLGGGLGGWRISASLAYLVAAIAFGAMFTAFSTRWLFHIETRKDEPASVTHQADTLAKAPPATQPTRPASDTASPASTPRTPSDSAPPTP